MGSSEEAAIEYLKTEVESNPAWNELSAVKNGRYIVLDKALFHYKPNARWVKAMKYSQTISTEKNKKELIFITICIVALIMSILLGVCLGATMNTGFGFFQSID